MAFNKDELKEIAKLLKEQGEMQDKINKSMSSYVEHLKKIKELQKNIQHVSEQLKNLQQEENDLADDLQSKIKDRNKGTKKEIADRRKEIKLIIDKIKAKRISVELTKKELGNLEKVNEAYVEQAQNVNKVHLGLKAANDTLKKVPGLLNKGYGKLKGTGIFDLEKSARMAAMEMGIVAKNTNGFRQNIYKAAESTLMMGAGVKDLAKMQAAYSSHLGRTTQLSREGLEAMAGIAKGTVLGEEGAAAMAAAMERFNVSAVDAAGIVEETMNMSQKMGINGNKVLKSLQNNLKMANKYHFKGGIQGMVKMAAQAEKFNISMDATAGMADKLFDIEGAVEMAAKLNTMGGEWSKLGDPMQLMFKARNDMQGLQEDVIGAAAGMADFNKETGEFEFSGLELHRMRELSKITGISVENMAEMSKQQAKFNKVRGQMGGTGISDEMMEFVEAQAQFNSDTGKFEIKLEGSEKAIPVNELKKIHEQELVNTQKSLKLRAEQTQTFDDTLSATIEEMKILLLPVLEGVNKVLPNIRATVKGFMKNKWADKLKDAARSIGNIVGGAIKFLTDWPKMTAGIIGAVLGGQILWNLGKWFINGTMLGRGFMSTAGGMGGGGGMFGGGRGGGGKWGSGTSMGGMYQKGGYYKGGQRWNGAGKIPKGSKFMKGGMTTMGKGMGVGMLASLGSMGLDAGRSMMTDQSSTGAKALGVASGALGGAGTGIMMGSMFGPIGMAVGGIIGAIGGGVMSYIEENKPMEGMETGTGLELSDGKFNDAWVSGGKIQPIDSKDKVFEVSKPGGAFDRARNSGPGTRGSGSNGSGHKIHISFDTLKITSDDSVGKIDLSNDSVFVAELASQIKQALSQTANGGVLNPNPS
jgi:hypothetical protein